MLFTSAFLVLATAVSAASAQAASPISCAQLQQIQANDDVSSSGRRCAGTLCNDQIRATALRFQGGTEEELAQMSARQLRSRFEPAFRSWNLGGALFESVDISLGDNPFEAFFYPGTTRLVGITVEDGSVLVDGRYCDVDLEPATTQARLQAVCEAVVTEVRSQDPGKQLTVAHCMNDIARAGVTLASHSRISLTYDVRANTQNLGGGYFVCSVRLDRRSDRVRAVSCNVR